MLNRTTAWPALFALAATLSVAAITTGSLPPGQTIGSIRDSAMAPRERIERTESPLEFRFPAIWWRPISVAMDLRVPGAVGPDPVAVVVSIDEVPARRLTLGGDWRRYVVRSTRSDSPPHGLRIQLDRVQGNPDAIEVGTMTVRPAGVSWMDVVLLLLGGAVGLGAWCLLPTAQPFRARVRTLGRARIASLVTHPAWASRDRPNPWVIGVLAAIPVAHVATLIWRYSVDVPFGDQWELVPLLAALRDGHLRLGDLWAPHNEHIILFPRLLMLGLAMLSGWDTRWENAASALLAAGTLAIIIGLLRHLSSRDTMTSLWAIPVAGVLVFSAKQWENWLWGWQVQVFLSNLSVAGMVLLLSRRQLRATHVGGAIALAGVASFSFGSGLVSWAIGLIPLLTSRAPARPRFLAAWIGSGVTIVILYAASFHVTAEGPNTAGIAAPVPAHIYALGLYVTKYLGSPLAGRPDTAVALGALGLSLYGVLGVRALRQGAGAEDFAFITLGSYALGAALLTALGRAELGSDQAMSSRYSTISAILWIAIAAELARHGGQRATAAGSVGRACAVATITLIAARASYLATPAFESRHDRLAAGREALVVGRVSALTLLHPDPALVERRRDTLQAHGWSVFRDEGRDDE